MGLQKFFADRFDFRIDSFILFQSVFEFVFVHFEFLFLKQNNSSRFRDINTLSVKAFSFSDQLKDFVVEIYP